MAYLLAIYVSGIFVGFAIGRRALERAETYKKESLSMLLALFIGLVLLTIAQGLPVVGGFISFLTVVLGLGAMFSALIRREPAEAKKRARKR
jgi:NhaP-type Na+/H+ or K+/H+ antiporter